MDSVEAMAGEWNSISEFYYNQDSEFSAAQLFDNFSVPNQFSWDSCSDLPNLLPHPDYFAIGNVDFENNNNNNTANSFENVNKNQIPSANSSSNLMDYFTETAVQESDIPSERSRKRPRNPCPVQKNKPRKTRSVSSNGEDDDDDVILRKQSSSSFYSEGESDVTKNKENVALNSNGKKRATRGSATDPQSIYARKRRERINERLRVLQNLVPNGTKVDISTMLEEAVQYVKFLQLQIKLLSSDDMWMYAPIAYNGMDLSFITSS